MIRGFFANYQVSSRERLAKTILRRNAITIPLFVPTYLPTSKQILHYIMINQTYHSRQNCIIMYVGRKVRSTFIVKTMENQFFMTFFLQVYLQSYLTDQHVCERERDIKRESLLLREQKGT